MHRASLRRNSWNFAKGQVSVDLHWRLQGGPQEDWLSRQMWESAETFELPGQSVRLQSPEFSVVTALGHGFAAGEERGIALQTIVDSAWLLPLCKSDRLFPALKRAGLLARFATLLSVLEAVGLGKSLPSDLTDFAGHSKAGSEKTGESSTSTQASTQRGLEAEARDGSLAPPPALSAVERAWPKSTAGALADPVGGTVLEAARRGCRPRERPTTYRIAA